MLNYAICEISGKQYKVLPNSPFEIDYQGEGGKDIEASVLLIADEGKLHLGKPYLKEKLTLNFVENLKGEKIRVAKFHAKANYRRVSGSKRKLTKLILSVKK